MFPNPHYSLHVSIHVRDIEIKLRRRTRKVLFSFISSGVARKDFFIIVRVVFGLPNI